MSKVKSGGRRVVSVPADLGRALAEDVGAKERFAGLSPSCKREYVEWIVSAKRDQTRKGRIERAMAMLARGEGHIVG